MYIPLLCLAVIVLSSISTRLLCRLLNSLSLNFDMSCEFQSIQALFPIICRLYFNCLSLILFKSLIAYLIFFTISSLLKFSVHHLLRIFLKNYIIVALSLILTLEENFQCPLPYREFHITWQICIIFFFTTILLLLNISFREFWSLVFNFRSMNNIDH